MALVHEQVNQSGEHIGWVVKVPCECRYHAYDNRWVFNGNMEKPTFRESYLASSTYGENNEKRVCHSYVTDGFVEYCGDCTHDLKGQRHPLIDFEL